MDSLVVWIVLVTAAVILYQRIAGLSLRIKEDQQAIDSMRTELRDLGEKVAALTDEMERLTLTDEQLEEKHFDKLPALTSDLFVSLKPGDKASLVLKDYTHGIYSIDYVHQELVYRTPGQKDAVAHGKARFDKIGGLHEVRILFSRPNLTATLRGGPIDGHVKEGRMLPNSSLKPPDQSLRD